MGLGGLQPGVWNNGEGKYFEGHLKFYVSLHTYILCRITINKITTLQSESKDKSQQQIR